MPRMPDLFHQAEEAVFGRHHDVPLIPATQESTMTTPQRPRAVDTLHALTGEIAGNRLAAELIESNLGSMLSASEIGTVLAFVSGIEDPRRRAQAQQQHDAAQQQAG